MSSGMALSQTMTCTMANVDNDNTPSTSTNNNNTSPLAQMMAKKFNMTIPTTSSNTHTSLMGRRVHTVSAGLAYGSSGFQMDSDTRMSKFELKATTASALSISSGGSGGCGYGKNEEW
jgi:hypothetical protein